MKFRSLPCLVGSLLALVASLLLASCGGGGAAGSPQTAGSLIITPSVGTIYAGVPFTFQVLGGRTPYALSSTEPGLLPVPSQINGHSFDVVASNPGVVDIGQQPGQLPSRTVTVTVRSGDGQTATAKMDVGQNFLTGYGVVFSPLTCPIAAGSIPAGTQACAGGETAVQMSATFNGNLAGDRQFRFEVLKGQYQWVFPQGGVAGNTVTIPSDHTGHITAILQVNAGAATQIAVMRVIDVATGVYEDHAFVITGSGGTGALTALPDTITFTGNLTTDCGVGTATFLVFDGTPPYTAVSSNPAITVNSSSSSNPGQFTVRIISNTPPCQTGTVIVTDSLGLRTTVDVQSQAGAGQAPTPATFSVAPTSITLACATSGSVSAVGGTGSYTTTSTTPLVTATVSGSTVTITRAGPAGPGTGTMTSTVSVTDGATIQTVTVTSPATCP